MVLLLSVLCSALLATASIQYDNPRIRNLAAVLAVAILAAAGSCVRWPETVERSARRLAPMALGALVALALWIFLECSWLATLQMRVPSRRLDVPGVAVAVVAIVAASYATGWRFASRWRFPLVVLVAAALGAWVIVSWPRPRIDVWRLQQDARAQLVLGIDPYAADHPTIPWLKEFDGEPVRKGRFLRSFPYPPLSLLLVLPGHWAGGDVRWSLLAATLGAAVLMVATGRRLGLPAGHAAELAAVAFLFHPQSLRVLYNAWTEPLLLLGMAAFLYAVARGSSRLSGLALAAVVIVKQSGFLWLAPALSTGRLTRRGMLLGAVSAALVVLPFVIWDPAAFWLGNVTYHLSSQPRADSLSIPAVWAEGRGTSPPVAPGLILSAAMALAVWRWAGPSLARCALGGAACYAVFFLFGKAGHLNYYWLVNGLVMVAAVTSYAELAAPVRFPESRDSANL